MALAWNETDLPLHSSMFARRNFSRSGGLTITGIEQVVQSFSDFWAATIAFKIRNSTQILAYRALQAQQWGRAAQWLIPACPHPGLPLGPPPPLDYSFDVDFAVDFSLESMAPPALPPDTDALSDAAAALNARSLTFHMLDTRITPKPGMFFSIGDRLYMIGTISGGPAYSATFAPGLRAAAPSGTAMNFATPHCLMRLAQDNSGEMNLEQFRFADISLSFVEVPA
jgi:hypothetical protein